MKMIVKERDIAAYTAALRREERAEGTIEQYCRTLRAFSAWLCDKEVTQELLNAYKAHLSGRDYAPVTINAMLAALNGFFRFEHWPLRAKFLKVQRRLFRDAERELTRPEYQRLLGAAEKLGRGRLDLLMETICATGIRVSEVCYITVEAARQGRTEIAMKGKIRTILLPQKLCRKLLKCAKQQNIASGEIFLTKGGKGMTRRQIWYEMKQLYRETHVDPKKIFPHNLRHLFATVYYRACKDIAQLADVLGHSNIETTRIYLITSGTEYRRQMDRLRLVQ